MVVFTAVNNMKHGVFIYSHSSRCLPPASIIVVVVLCFRNKQLRAHLVSEARELEAVSEGNAAQLLCQREQELEQKCDEIDELQHQLDAAQTVSTAPFVPLHARGLVFHSNSW
jgi:broad-specificity NMP kinase